MSKIQDDPSLLRVRTGWWLRTARVPWRSVAQICGFKTAGGSARAVQTLISRLPKGTEEGISTLQREVRAWAGTDLGAQLYAWSALGVGEETSDTATSSDTAASWAASKGLPWPAVLPEPLKEAIQAIADEQAPHGTPKARRAVVARYGTALSLSPAKLNQVVWLRRADLGWQRIGQMINTPGDVLAIALRRAHKRPKSDPITMRTAERIVMEVAGPHPGARAYALMALGRPPLHIRQLLVQPEPRPMAQAWAMKNGKVWPPAMSNETHKALLERALLDLPVGVEEQGEPSLEDFPQGKRYPAAALGWWLRHAGMTWEAAARLIHHDEILLSSAAKAIAKGYDWSWPPKPSATQQRALQHILGIEDTLNADEFSYRLIAGGVMPKRLRLGTIEEAVAWATANEQPWPPGEPSIGAPEHLEAIDEALVQLKGDPEAGEGPGQSIDPDTLGERAYSLKGEGNSWSSIARALEFDGPLTAMRVAQEWSQAQEKTWPPQPPTRGRWIKKYGGWART